MAQIEVKVPQLSESVAEATLLSWHKKVGEAVSRDENLIDIETDKVVLEQPLPKPLPHRLPPLPPPARKATSPCRPPPRSWPTTT